jgi:hypothetical protein
VEVGTVRKLYALVRRKAALTMARARPRATEGESRIAWPTVVSTRLLASAAPRKASGAISTRARPGRIAPAAYGMPMHAPV